jgi:hypothetical protein
VLNFFAKSLPSGQTQQHKKKNKEVKKPRQEEKQGVQETKTRRKTSHSKSLQRMTWSEDFGKAISRTKIFPKKFPNFSFANKSREKEVRELQEMKLSIYKIDLIH